MRAEAAEQLGILWNEKWHGGVMTFHPPMVKSLSLLLIFFLNEGIMLRRSLSWTPRFVPMFAQPERRAWVSGNFAEEFALKLQQEAAMATGADETVMFLCFVHFRACLHIK